MAASPVDYWNPYTETLPREKIDRLQVNNFRRMAAYAKEHCAFYRDLYQDIDISDIRSLADIRMLPLVEKGNFRSIMVDTAVMNLPATAFSLAANRLIKQEFGLPVGCAPANGTYMWRKSAGLDDKSQFPPVDAAVEAITALGSDFMFYGPMTGSDRVFFSVAAATSLLTIMAYQGGTPLPGGIHPLNQLFPDMVTQLQKEEGRE